MAFILLFINWRNWWHLNLLENINWNLKQRDNVKKWKWKRQNICQFMEMLNNSTTDNYIRMMWEIKKDKQGWYRANTKPLCWASQPAVYNCSISHQPTLPLSRKLPAVTHIPFFKLHAKWCHVGTSLLHRCPQKKQLFTIYSLHGIGK